VFYTYDELYYEDFTSATREFCYPCWTFTVKLYNFGCSYCVLTGCTQDRKEAQQQQRKNLFGRENRIESKLFCPNWNALVGTWHLEMLRIGIHNCLIRIYVTSSAVRVSMLCTLWFWWIVPAVFLMRSVKVWSVNAMYILNKCWCQKCIASCLAHV